MEKNQIYFVKKNLYLQRALKNQICFLCEIKKKKKKLEENYTREINLRYLHQTKHHCS